MRLVLLKLLCVGSTCFCLGRDAAADAIAEAGLVLRRLRLLRIGAGGLFVAAGENDLVWG